MKLNLKKKIQFHRDGLFDEVDRTVWQLGTHTLEKMNEQVTC